jgi:glyoxylase-like metal-dependent hydrolase (beta-lactamase superfamily II)
MWQVLYTPGHTLGRFSLNLPQERELIVGDTVHRGNVRGGSIRAVRA